MVVARGGDEAFIHVAVFGFCDLLYLLGKGVQLAEDLDEHAHVVALVAVVPAHLLPHLSDLLLAVLQVDPETGLLQRQVLQCLLSYVAIHVDVFQKLVDFPFKN